MKKNQALILFLIGMMAFAPGAFSQENSLPSGGASRCESQFHPVTLRSVLPEDMQSSFAELSPKLRLKLEKRFADRSRIDAETEARKLVSNFLTDHESTQLPLGQFLRNSTRKEATQEVLRARLRAEDRRVRLEDVLLEIGYKRLGPKTKKWRDFRSKHSRELAIAAKTAKNTATTMLVGAPLFLKSTRFQNFEVPRSQRTEWRTFVLDSEMKIANGDSKLLREVKIEFAVEFVSRVAAYTVLALIADELLSSLSPQWRHLKVSTFGPIAMESRFEMEKVAFTNWQAIVEAFTGEKPTVDSPEALDILNRIRSSNSDILWNHIHKQGPLDDVSQMSSPLPLTESEAVQTFPEPIPGP